MVNVASFWGLSAASITPSLLDVLKESSEVLCFVDSFRIRGTWPQSALEAEFQNFSVFLTPPQLLILPLGYRYTEIGKTWLRSALVHAV